MHLNNFFFKLRNMYIMFTFLICQQVLQVYIGTFQKEMFMIFIIFKGHDGYIGKIV